jgi:hypothetical protein
MIIISLFELSISKEMKEDLTKSDDNTQIKIKIKRYKL